MAEFYNTKKIDQKGCKWNWIVGARRIGKTFDLTTKMVNEYLNGGCSVWIRDFKNQFDAQFCEKMLKDVKKHGICPPEWEARPGVGVFTSDDKKADIVCYFQSINRSSSGRGGSTDNVNLVLFDEFMPEKGNYPKSALKSLQSVVVTYTSARDEGRFYGASNFISSSNPYFVGMRIYPDINKDVTAYTEDSVAIEICRGYQTAKVPGSGIAKGLKRGRYPEYDDPTEDAMFSLIAKSPKGDRFNFMIQNEGIVYQLIHHGNFTYFSEFKGNIPSGTYVCTSNKDEIGAKVRYRPKWLYDQLKLELESSTLRFSDPNCMFAITKMFFTD